MTMRFRERVAIHGRSSRTTSARGGVVEGFAVVAGLESVAATRSPRGWAAGSAFSQTMSTPDMTALENEFSVILAGDHSAEVVPGMRCVMSDDTYDIVSVGPTLGHTQTLLTVRKTVPEGVPV